MSTSLGDKVEQAMQTAGIKPRTFAALVGCHYSTIYDLLKNRETVIPLKVYQEKIYNVLDFITDTAQTGGEFPLDAKLTLSEKTEKMEALYKLYSKDAPATLG